MSGPLPPTPSPEGKGVPKCGRVAIVGAGSWATALSTLLPRCERVALWSDERDVLVAMERDRVNARYLPKATLHPNAHAVVDLEAALADAEVVVFAVASAGMCAAAERAAPLVPADALIVSASKGLEEAGGRRMSEVVADALARSRNCPRETVLTRVAALSGPNLAVEVAAGVPTASVAASTTPETALACQALWMGPTFRVYTSHDPVGVELAGALKNVIAIGAGVCEGLGYGDNSRATLMTRGLAEIRRLGVALGADPQTFLGLAGVGDLIATGGSRLSRNYRVGIGLAEGRPLDDILAGLGQVAEGVPTTRAACKLARGCGVDMPIAESLARVMFEGGSVRDELMHLMLRPPRDESEI